MHSISEIATELRRVARWFSRGGTYYDADANILSTSGKIVQATSPKTRRHKVGHLNPKTMREYSYEERTHINAIKPHNLVHDSAARREHVNGMSLPSDRSTVAECRPEELKAMVIARGGNVTGGDGKALNQKELRKTVRAYLSLESQNSKHTVYFNRDRHHNGIFSEFDTSERKTIPEMITQLIRCKEFELPLRNFFAELWSLVKRDCFIEDYSTIAMQAPKSQRG